jgi:endo-1,4-beta-mannosidase
MQYLHNNLKMHTVYGGKVQYPHYDHNPWEREMQYMHNNLKMHTIHGWQNVILASWSKNTIKKNIMQNIYDPNMKNMHLQIMVYRFNQEIEV